MNHHLAGTLSSEFLSSAGHELRNPLATVIAQAEMLLDGVHGPLSEPQSAALRAIHAHACQTSALITDLVDAARLSAESLKLQPCDLSQAAEKALKQAGEGAAARSIQLNSLLPPGLTLQGDPQRLQQMLTELLAAALLVTPAHGLLKLSLKTENGSILLQATGNASLPAAPGHDSTASVLPQLHKLRPIGLALLERMARLHQGHFTVSSAANHADVFTIRLPALIAAAPPAPATEAPVTSDSPPPSQPAARSQFILIADDQTALVNVACAYLESLGFQVATARDGQEAVNLARKLLPDLIFMDVCMPILDGLSAIRQIRAAPDSKLHTIPIICLSGGAGTADREKCAAAGATAFLGKPFGIREIDRVIQDHLQPAAS